MKQNLIAFINTGLTAIRSNRLAMLALCALLLAAQSTMAAGAVPADITGALDDVSATFTAIIAVATVVAVVLLGFRLMRKSIK